MEDTNKVPNDEIVKALGEFLSEEEVQDILQKASPVEEEEKKEGDEEGGDMEKAYGAKKSEYEEMAKALETKKAEMAELEKRMGCKKGEEDELGKEGESDDKEGKEEGNIEKAEKDDILKGFVNGISDRLSKSEEAQSSIMKSLEAFSENQSKILETIERIGNQPIGLKSARSLNFIEKGGMEDEGDKKSLHLQRDKAAIEKALDDLIESTEDPIKRGKYEVELLNYNAGGTPISKSLRNELESKNDFVIL